MKIRIYFFGLILFTSFVFKGNSEQKRKSKTSHTLAEIIDSEFSKFRPVAKANDINLGKIIFIQTQQSHIKLNNPTNDISINLHQIENFTQNTSEEFKSLFVRFVIAHEVGHIIQSKGYKKEVLDSKRSEGNVFLECEADILAGILISEEFNGYEIPELVNNNPDFDQESYTLKMTEVLFEVFKKILDMDNANVFIKSHPSNFQRFTAVRSGQLAGNILNFHFMRDFYDTTTTIPQPPNLAYLKTAYNNLSKALDFNPNAINDPQKSNIYIWANSEAIRIINRFNAYSSNLVLFNKEIKWDTTAEHPFVKFSFIVLNKSQSVINFSGRVCTELIPRHDKNILKNFPIDAYIFNRLISPQDTIMISGEIEWRMADKDFMPSILLPGDPRSLYWAYVQANPAADTFQVESFDIKFDQWNSGASQDIIDIIDYTLRRKNEFLNYRKGIGISSAESKDEVDEFPITYRPLFMSNSDENKNIYFSLTDEKIKFVLKAFTWKDSLKAVSAFNEIIKEIEISLSGYVAEEIQVRKYLKYKDYYTTNESKAFEVGLSYNNLKKEYSIKIEVYGD